LTAKKSQPESVNSTRSHVPEKQSGRNEDTRKRMEKTTHPEKEDVLLKKLEAAESKADEYYDRLLRLTAEFENYKKRSEREMNDFRKFANESLMKEILPVVDNLERAALAMDYRPEENTLKGLRDGVEMTLKGLTDSLARFGVTPVEALGQPFDPNFHQAVSQEESDAYPDGTVCRELQKGYLLKDRLLRPAMVIVSRSPNKTKTADSKDSGAQSLDGSEGEPAESREGGKKIKVTVH
jgi:molecular chaperone GrpE